MISLYSCEDKTQTTQTQTKSDVNLFTSFSYNSINYYTDSSDAVMLLPRMIGKIQNTSSDTIVNINFYTIFTDSTNNNFKKYFYMKYTNQSNEVKYCLFKYYDEISIYNDTPAAFRTRTTTVGGTMLTCTETNPGTCSMTCDMLLNDNTKTVTCGCGPALASGCSFANVNVSIGSNDTDAGTTAMANLTIPNFIFNSSYFTIQP